MSMKSFVTTQLIRLGSYPPINAVAAPFMVFNVWIPFLYFRSVGSSIPWYLPSILIATAGMTFFWLLDTFWSKEFPIADQNMYGLARSALTMLSFMWYLALCLWISADSMISAAFIRFMEVLFFISPLALGPMSHGRFGDPRKEVAD